MKVQGLETCLTNAYATKPSNRKARGIALQKPHTVTINKLFCQILSQPNICIAVVQTQIPGNHMDFNFSMKRGYYNPALCCFFFARPSAHKALCLRSLDRKRRSPESLVVLILHTTVRLLLFCDLHSPVKQPNE